MVELIGRHWWAVGLRGVAALLFGILALAWPVHTLVVLVALFGAYALVDGIFALVATVRAATRHRAWGLLLLEGLGGIAAGIVTFAWPGITALALLYVIAAWALVTGVLEVAAAFTARAEVAPAWLIGLSGVASVIFGMLLILFPGAGALGRRVLFSVRPQTIRVARQRGNGAGWWLEGRVVKRAYLGDYWDYVVAPGANGGAATLRVAAPPQDVFEDDEAVWLEIDPERVAYIPEGT